MLLAESYTHYNRIYTTYHWPNEVLSAFLKLLKGILLSACAFDHIGDAAGTNIVQNGLDLVICGGVFGDIKLKLFTKGCCLGGMIAGLVNSRIRGSIGGDLLEKIGDSHGCRRAGLVKDRHSVERLALFVR